MNTVNHTNWAGVIGATALITPVTAVSINLATAEPYSENTRLALHRLDQRLRELLSGRAGFLQTITGLNYPYSPDEGCQFEVWCLPEDEETVIREVTSGTGFGIASIGPRNIYETTVQLSHLWDEDVESIQSAILQCCFTPDLQIHPFRISVEREPSMLRRQTMVVGIRSDRADLLHGFWQGFLSKIAGPRYELISIVDWAARTYLSIRKSEATAAIPDYNSLMVWRPWRSADPVPVADLRYISALHRYVLARAAFFQHPNPCDDHATLLSATAALRCATVSLIEVLRCYRTDYDSALLSVLELELQSSDGGEESNLYEAERNFLKIHLPPEAEESFRVLQKLMLSEHILFAASCQFQPNDPRVAAEECAWNAAREGLLSFCQRLGSPQFAD